MNLLPPLLISMAQLLDIMEIISASVRSSALTYAEFRELTDELLAQGRTTNEDNREEMLAYTRQNIQRMNKWDRILQLSDDSLLRLRGVERPVVLLTLVEGWCGDVAQVLPVLDKIANANDRIELRIIFRDQHPEIMDAFLTNGTRAIPKVLVLDAESGQVLGTWGPRPSEAQAMVMDMKQTVQILPEEERADFRARSSEAMHAWYARDKGQRVQIEFLNTLMPLVRQEMSV